MKVRQVYFLTETESEANLSDNNAPLHINCTGTEYFYSSFESQSFRYDYSFVYTLSGKMNFEINGTPYALTSGSFIVIPPKSDIKFGTDDCFLNYFWMQFTGNRAEALLKKTNILTNKVYKAKMTEDAVKIINDINQEFILNDELFNLTATAKLIEFFSLISREIYHRSNDFSASIGYIHCHYNEELSVSRLAKAECLSDSQYRASFKKNIGISPKEYITKLRLNMCCYYLANTKYSISEIAYKIGYKDSLYLSRIFRKKIGVTASEYRKQKNPYCIVEKMQKSYK